MAGVLLPPVGAAHPGLAGERLDLVELVDAAHLERLVERTHHNGAVAINADVEIAPLDPVEDEFGFDAAQIIRDVIDMAAAVDMDQIVGQEYS